MVTEATAATLVGARILARENAAAQRSPTRITFSAPPPDPERDKRLAEAQAAREAAERQRAIALLIKHSGVPERYADATLAAEPPAAITDPAEVRAWTWTRDRLRGLATTWGMLGLVGTRGPGKTWLAAGLVNDCVRGRRSARYAKALRFFLDLKSTYREGSTATENAIIDDYVRPDVLVLDEVNERGETDWENRLLTYVIDLRYDAMKATVLISNDTPATFIKSVGESIADRIRERGRIVECTWRSLREPKPAENSKVSG
jgi:DNA replication protein DnaC